MSELDAPSVVMRIVYGERPGRPEGAQQLGLVEPVWDMMVRCWQGEPTHRPAMTTVVGFLRDW